MTISSREHLIDFAQLKKTGKNLHEKYSVASPFPHRVIDDIFADEVLDEIVAEFDGQAGKWHRFESKYEKKLQESTDEKLGPVTRRFIHELNSAPFINFLQELTGIEGLIPDPYLIGGGLHKIEQGGKLGVHVDFNQHSKMKVYRRINVILYLNRGWKDEYGGHLELWSKAKLQCVKKITPLFNRLAIFNTTSSSYHGHPAPLNCPQECCRRSLALYYYTALPESEDHRKPHSTIFLDKHGREEELKGSTFLQRLMKRLKSYVNRN